MISPSLPSLSTGRSENSVSSLIAENFRWQKLPEGSGTFEITTSAAHTNDPLRRNTSAKNITDLRPFSPTIYILLPSAVCVFGHSPSVYLQFRTEARASLNSLVSRLLFLDLRVRLISEVVDAKGYGQPSCQLSVSRRFHISCRKEAKYRTVG